MWSPTVTSDELYHHGILGMKWGVRRYQNKDGTLTPAGRKRLNMVEKRSPGLARKATHPSLTDENKAKLKKIAIGTAVVGGTLLAAYGAYKYSDFIKSSAAKDIINKGNKIADDLVKKAEFEKIRSFSGTTPSMRMHNQVLFGQRAANLHTQAVDARKAAVDKANDIGKSFTKSAKYLYENSQSNRGAEAVSKVTNMSVKKATSAAAKTSGPKLEFGGSPSSSRSSDDIMEKLIKNSITYGNMATQSRNASSKSTGQKDYTEQLLNRNGGKLKNMTMDDLKKLDLY